MQCTGIICEYNPFHKGHQYHINEAKRLTGNQPVIAVMSGNFVQRGEPAILDKWRRTEMALREGVALVIEIPTCCSTASSEYYAGAGIRLLENSGIASHISFGVEDADTHLLETVSNIVFHEPAEYTALLKKQMNLGLGYAAARADALSMLTGCDPATLRSPNFILGVEYYKAIRRYDSSLVPIPILRQGQYHDASMDTPLPSASAIRQAIRQGDSWQNAIPHTSTHLLSPEFYADPIDSWSQELYYRLCFHTADSLRQIPDIAEGLENRILKYTDHPRRISELVSLLSTKRYPKSRIRRILLRILLDIRSIQEPSYIRVLGFRKDSQSVLSELTAHSKVPVITNLARQLPQLPQKAQNQLYEEIRCTNLYNAHTASAHLGWNAELTKPLIIL